MFGITALFSHYLGQ